MQGLSKGMYFDVNILCTEILTINVPVVYMARDVMIWMQAIFIRIFLRGPLEGVGSEIETFLGPEMATSEAIAI